MTKTKKLFLLFATVLVVVIVATGAVWFNITYTDCSMSEETFEEITDYKPENYLDSGILYADKEKAVFYCFDGVFSYNYNEDKIEQMIDIKLLNCAINEHKQNKGTTIHSDGEKIAFVNYGDDKEKYDNYLVYIKTGLAKKENEPALNDKLHSIVMTSWISNTDFWRSGMCSYVGDEMFYMELDKGDEIAQLKLVISDKNTNDRREFYPFGNN